MKTIAVLLTVHNRKAETLKCLEHLFAQQSEEGYQLEVYLTDDGCTDGTPRTVAKQYPSVHIIQGDGTLFWNRGMYRAWEAASKAKEHDFYLWLNDDTVLFSLAIKGLLNISEKHEHKSIVIGSTCSEKNQKITYGGFNSKGSLIDPEKKKEQECYAFNGNCVLIPNYVFHKIGNLDPLFHHAIGDLDYGLRAKKAQLKNIVFPGYIGYCEEHETLPQWCIKEVPLGKRIKTLYSPLGSSQPYYFFRFELRHYGLITAVKHLLSIHLRMFYPQLWKK